MKLVTKLRVKNAMGLHTRPATTIVKLLSRSKSQVSFTYKKETVNAKSILGILMLAVKRNCLVTVTIEGEDAEETLQQLASAFENQFQETV